MQGHPSHHLERNAVRLRFVPFILVSRHVALVVAAAVLCAKITVWIVRLAIRLLVGAIRLGVAAMRLVAAPVRSQLSRSDSVAPIATPPPHMRPYAYELRQHPQGGAKAFASELPTVPLYLPIAGGAEPRRARG
jgi:hypothetical protein